MPVSKTDIPTFAKAVKEKYPEYKDVNDTVLTKAIIDKYPEYKDHVDLSGIDKPPSPVDQGIDKTTEKVNQPIQFNGTFQPDLEGEKKGLYTNDPDYQKQKTDFVSKIMTDTKGNLMYPEQDTKGNWVNYYTKEPIVDFNPHEMGGKILQVPHEYLAATGGKKFITPVYNPTKNAYDFPDVRTPDVPHEQTLPEATVYGSKKGGSSGAPPTSGPASLIAEESQKQGGQFGQVLKGHPELDQQIQETIGKYGPEYTKSLLTGSQGMSNVLQKTVEDHYDLNKPLPANVDPEVLNGHLNILNNFDKNKQEFEGTQQELQHQADLMADRAKRTGQPIVQDDYNRLNEKFNQNVQKWNDYTKSVKYAQNFVQQPEVKEWLDTYTKKQSGLKLLDEIRQRSFPGDNNAQIKQDEYDRRAIEGNLNAWDYAKTFLGKAGAGVSNIAESAIKLSNPTNITSGIGAEKLNNAAQQFLSSNLPSISPDALEQISKGKGGISLLANDLASTLGGFAPYIIPGMAEEGLGAKAATFATALAESLPTVRKEAEKAGLTGAAYNTYLTAKPLVGAAFMTLLPNVKFAKGFERDVAESVVKGEFNSPKTALLNLAAKAVKDPNDIAHLQAMLSGTAMGNAIVNNVTNTLQAKDDIDRGINRKQGLSTDLSEVFNPKQTAVMALAGKVLQAVPTLKNAIGDNIKGKEIQETYDHIQNNMVELAANNLQGASDQVAKLIKKDPGNIYAQHLKNTLEDFAYAKARMPEGLEPEQEAALFNIQQQISTLNRQSAYADPSYKPHIQKNIDELNKQVSEILKNPQKANDHLQDAHKNLTDQIQNQEPDNSNLDKKGRQKVILNHLLDNPGDTDGAFKKAGYTNVEGFWVEPGAESAFKALSDETKGILRKHGVKFIENTGEDTGAGGHGASITTPEGPIRGVGLRHYGDNYTGDRHNHVAIHELGHAVWSDLPQETKDLFNNGNPLSEHGKNVQGGEGEYGELYGKAGGKSGWQVGEEDFADQFALNKGDLDKTIQDKKNQNISSPKTENNEGAEANQNGQAEGQPGQITEPKGGGETNSMKDDKVPSPIEHDPNFRTLDYGDNKGKEENKEAQEKIKQEIINDEPIGKTGERFSQFIGRVIPAIEHRMETEPHNTAIVTHSSVIKALQVWEEMGRPKVDESNIKEFAKRYTEIQPEAEGKVHTFKGEKGNDIKVVRHGETEDNKLSEFRDDNTQLTDKGIAQAGKAGDNLIKETGGNVPKIITSDLPRTLHTSDIINQKLKDHAISEQSPNEMGEQPIGNTSTGGSGESSGMEPSQQGEGPSGESGQPGQSPEEKESSDKEEPRTVGISHEALSKTAERLGLEQPKPGDVLTPEQYTQRGRDLIKGGADPEQVAADFKKDGKISADAVGVVKAHNEDLVMAADEAMKQFGKDSPEFKAALDAVDKWEKDVAKPMGTEWGRIGRTLVGETDLDTGSFVSVKRAAEKESGKPLTPEQEKEAQELSDKVTKLSDEVEGLKQKLSEALDKGSGNKKGGFTEKTKKAADTFRKLKTKEFTFKDKDGNDVPIQKMGVSWNDLVELGAKAIEKTGEIADGIAAILDKVKDAEWYKVLAPEDKDRFEKELGNHYAEIADKKTASRIKALEKQLSDLQSGEVKTKGPKRVPTAKEKELQDQIFDAKQALGLVKPKAIPKVAPTPISPQPIATRFANKKGNDFTPDEAKDIWDYAKTNYVDKGIDFNTMIKNVGTDLGLNADQVMSAITTPKGAKEITVEMFKKQYDRRKAMNAAKEFVAKAGNSKAGNFFKHLPSVFFNLKTYGHGTVGGITHAGANIFRPSVWKAYWPNFFKQFSLAYGDTGKYEMKIQGLKNKPNFDAWLQAKLAVDPNETYDPYQSKSKMSWLGEAGTRGFNALKFMRYDMAEMLYNRASISEKADPNLRHTIAELVNHATGHSEIKMPKSFNTIFFAPGLEASRWQRMITDPAKAIKTFATWDKSTPAEQAAAKIIASGYGQQIGMHMIMLAANAGLLAYAKSKQQINFTDPSKSDWLKFKAGDKTIDVSGGVMNPYRLLTTVGREAYLSAEGDKKDLKQKPADRDASLVTSQLRYKLAPLPGTGADVLTGQDAMGNVFPWSKVQPGKGKHKMNWFEYASQQTPIPIAAGTQAVLDGMRDEGLEKPQINNIINGLIQFGVEGFTGAKVADDYSLKDTGPTPHKQRQHKPAS